MKDDELQYWLAINRLGKFGGARFKRLYSYFPDLKTMWHEATLSDLLDARLEEKIAEEFFIKKKEIEPRHELELLRQHKIKVTTILDDDYPKLLKEIFNPPPLLFYLGEITNINDCAIAVVGTRKVSSYGKQMTDAIIADLAPHHIIIVSGLALGVDAEAHLSAIEHKTPTVAVLGSGLDRASIYPSSNRYLADQIIAHDGLLVSEFPIGTMPFKQNFPARNRIISGLSLGTLVIEAGEISGALITAAFALEQNREVFAVPGNVTSPNSFGANKLIKQGAQVVTGAADILEVLNLRQLVEFKENAKILPESPEEEKIFKALTIEPRHIDALVKLTKLAPPILNATLTLMELKGKVKNLGNQNYIVSQKSN